MIFTKSAGEQQKNETKKNEKIKTKFLYDEYLACMYSVFHQKGIHRFCFFSAMSIFELSTLKLL